MVSSTNYQEVKRVWFRTQEIGKTGDEWFEIHIDEVELSIFASKEGDVSIAQIKQAMMDYLIGIKEEEE